MDLMAENDDETERVVLSLSRGELILLASSVNEAIEAVEDWEFSTRLGATKSEALEMCAELGRLISGLPVVE